MKKLLLITLGLLLCLPAQGFGQKKKIKFKDKRFEPVVKQNPADYAGKYVGFQDVLFFEVSVVAEGRMLATSFEGNREAVLSNIRVDNARLTATKTYPDGATAQFSAVFVNRILNGETAFGMQVQGPIRIDETLLLERVFYRRQ